MSNFNKKSIIVVSLVLSFLTLNFVYGAFSFPNNTPSGEISGGKFMSYFNKILVSSSSTDGTVKKSESIGKNNANGLLTIKTNNTDILISNNLEVGDTVTAKTHSYTSDIRLKSNIKQLEGSLEKIQKLEGVNFNWINDKNDSLELGLIAQDVEKVYPEIVINDSNGIKSVDYASLIAPMIEAIKEQQREIDNLKNELNKLTNK